MNRFKNPFTLEPAQLKAQFFGRKREIRQALSFLHREQSISIVGPARIGKTSFSLYLAHPHVRGEQRLAEDQIFVYTNCRALANLEHGQCYMQIREDAINQIKRDISVDSAMAAQLEKTVREAGRETHHFGLQTLFRAARMYKLKLTLILDNFELLAQNPGLEDDFFSALRSLPTSYPMAYLVTSQYPLDTLERIRPEASPFFNIFQPLNLGVLNPEESRSLIVTLLKQSCVEPPEFIIDHILKIGGNEPYRLQQAGYITFEIWRENGGNLYLQHCQEISHRLEHIRR